MPNWYAYPIRHILLYAAAMFSPYILAVTYPLRAGVRWENAVFRADWGNIDFLKMVRISDITARLQEYNGNYRKVSACY
jgi:hypothetical protein